MVRAIVLPRFSCSAFTSPPPSRFYFPVSGFPVTFASSFPPFEVTNDPTCSLSTLLARKIEYAGFAGIDKCRETCLTQLERGLKASPERLLPVLMAERRKRECLPEVFATVNWPESRPIKTIISRDESWSLGKEKKKKKKRVEGRLESFDCSSGSSSLNSGNLEMEQSVEYIFLLFELNCIYFLFQQKREIQTSIIAAWRGLERDERNTD